ncbi:family 20 glycosylhydrolase [Microbacterium sp. P03]|uniref:family 20 glycosylhydrolase n=1 Tax=Microbacterium sp. P03 TaxID=3366946 RepID=UPI00374692D1
MTFALVPFPLALTATEGRGLRLREGATIAGESSIAAGLAQRLSERTGLAVEASPEQSERARVDLRVRAGGSPESYEIVVDEASAVITASDAAGLFYGAQTLVQLVQQDAGGWFFPTVAIEDRPRFAYRGVMLDVARHFFPVETVTAYIDRAAALKFNHLHLHLSDDQGWRLQLASRPRLTEVSSGSSVGGDPGGFFTHEDYAEIVRHAASRHMTVVPEFDVPGHTHAVGVAYPELVERPVLSAQTLETVQESGGSLPEAGVPYDGVAVGFSSLKIHDEATYAFLADVFGELAELTPGPYVHIGGDEALGTDPADFAEFMTRASSMVVSLGKTPIAWHEAGAAAGLDRATIGQYWGFTTPIDGAGEKTRTFVQRGSRVILSPADAIYLDMKPHADSALGLTWANGPTSLERAYSWDPGTTIEGVDESDILGVEAPLWSETPRTLADLDALAFPRIAAAAEISWSPARGVERTWDSFRTRVDGLGPLWTSQGITLPRAP